MCAYALYEIQLEWADGRDRDTLRVRGR